MFAYCGNKPVNNCDPLGYCTCAAANLRNEFAYSNMCSNCGYAPGGGGALVLPGLIDSVDEAASSILFAVSYAYRQFTQGIKQSAYGMPPGSYPITHHIVPYGGYSTRDPYVQQQLAHAQSIMKNAGVDPEHDLVNQVVISVNYHLSLHSNNYILMVTTPIIALGENPTKDQIYQVLFYLRIGIAANDPYAYGY